MARETVQLLTDFMEIAERIRLITVPPDATIRQAMQAIESGALGVVLVCTPSIGNFLGLLTDGDIRRALLQGVGLEAHIELIPRPKSTYVRANTPREAVVGLFTEAIRVIPVLDDSDRVVDLALYDRRAHLPVAQPMLGERELVNVTECILTG